MNINKFTQKSIQAVNDCEKIAYDYGHQEIVQEHLLYALLTDMEGLITKLLTKMEIQPEVFQAQVEGALKKRPRVSGAAQVYIGNDVEIGENCIIYPGVKIYDGCKIGNNCILHANVVIGSDGFGFAPREDGSYKKIPQTGIVTLEDDVEIGANTVVDRATMGTTLIKKGVKLDNLIQIAHK